MITIPFIDQSMNQDYPLALGVGTATLNGLQMQQAWFCDAQIILGAASQDAYSVTPEMVYLGSDGTTLTCLLEIDYPNNHGGPLYFKFEAPTDATPGYTSLALGYWGSSSSLTTQMAGMAMLQFGNMKFFAASSSSWNIQAPMAPGTWVSAADHYVGEYNIANQLSTLVPGPCQQSSSYQVVWPAYTDQAGLCTSPDGERLTLESALTGAIIFSPALQCDVGTDPIANQITFMPAAGTLLNTGSSSLTCIAPRILPPGYIDPSLPSCDLVYSVGGASPVAGSNTIMFVGSPGVTISSPEAATILVTVDSQTVYPTSQPNACTGSSSTIVPLIPVTPGYEAQAIYEIDSTANAMPAGTALVTPSLAAGTYQLVYLWGAVSVNYASAAPTFNQVNGDGTGAIHVKYNNGGVYTDLVFPDMGSFSTYEEASAAWSGDTVSFVHAGGPLYIFVYSNNLLEDTGNIAFQLEVLA